MKDGQRRAAIPKNEFDIWVDRFLRDEKNDIRPFSYATAGGAPGFNASMTEAYRDEGTEMCLCGSAKEENGMILTYRSEKESLEATVEIERVCSGAYRQRVRLKNIGRQPIELTMLANRIYFFEYENKLRQDRYRFHYCTQTWYGEGQWHESVLYDVGLYDEGGAPPTSSFAIAGLSSQTTARFFPNVYVRDDEQNICCFCEIEPIGKWYMSLGLRRAWGEARGVLVMSCGCADDRTLNFYHRLAPGESYSSADCLFGFAEGGADDALCVQTKARRKARRRLPEAPPIFFNDYMNCLWANPDDKKCMRLAVVAKEIGADYYVMDAGWYCDLRESWVQCLGNWKTDSDRFEGGIFGWIEKMKSCGLIPGLWVELESCCDAVAQNFPSSWFVNRHGKRFGSESRRFFNFTEPDVRRYLYGQLKPLLESGVRFLKNDYNDSYFAFDEEECYNLQQNQLAFYDFIEDLYREYPDLIVENCASGAMRSDGGALRHFALQSFSDQDVYRLYPSIVKGSLRNILPEQLGIWCMPRPEHFSGKKLCEEEEQRDLIIFNIVSSLAGVPYLSGRIDLCSKEEKELLKRGVELAKELAPFIRNAYPQFPQGMSRISDRDWDSLALSDEQEKEKLLFVWRLEGAENNEFLLEDEWKLEQLFPPEPIFYRHGDRRLSVVLKNTYSAVLFRLLKS